MRRRPVSLVFRSAILLLLGGAALSTGAGCTKRESTTHAPRLLGAPRPGDLPGDPDAVLDHLLSDELRVTGAKDITSFVRRLDLAVGARTFRAKWKPMGEGGSEVQEGYDGNNAPRCEIAAWRLSRQLFGKGSTERHLVAPVAVRAFHRDVPCDRACARLPRAAILGDKATFAAENDHLVLGTLTFWLDGVTHQKDFHGGLFDPPRMARDPIYKRSFGDLCAFLYLEQHGDANYYSNFMAREPRLDRLYSIDNGRAFDGLSYYTDSADKDWDPFRHFDPDHMVATEFAPETLAAIAALDDKAAKKTLRAVTAIDLESGRVVREPSEDPVLAPIVSKPIVETAGFEKRGRGVYVGRAGGKPWVILGIGEQGISDVATRARALTAKYGRGSPAP